MPHAADADTEGGKEYVVCFYYGSLAFGYQHHRCQEEAGACVDTCNRRNLGID